MPGQEGGPALGTAAAAGLQDAEAAEDRVAGGSTTPQTGPPAPGLSDQRAGFRDTQSPASKPHRVPVGPALRSPGAAELCQHTVGAQETSPGPSRGFYSDQRRDNVAPKG